MTEDIFAVEMQGIVKKFPGVLANDHVDLQVRHGEIHALLGENGAGKSTLMNILSGLYQPDAGKIFINGEEVSFRSPREAIAKGIGMVHQHFMLVPTQTVMENLILGYPEPRFYIDYQRLEKKIKEFSQEFGLDVDPNAKIWQLSVGEQQRVEILKMLYHGAKILIMDEPTAVLTPQEVQSLFKTLRKMVSNGHTVIFISHKLDEVLEIADRITVLRRGRLVDIVDASSTNKSDLARRMVGREVLFRVQKERSQPGKVVLELQGVSCNNDKGLPALKNLNLQVRAGEILGVAGVAGNGQTEMAEVINGLREVTAGKVFVSSDNITNKNPVWAIDRGVAYIPADRTERGTAPNLSLTENIALKQYRKPPMSHGWAINWRYVKEYTLGLIKKFDIQTPSDELAVRMLSGGNLQKLILARELSLNPNVIVAVYPTRGLDVGATESVHQILIEQRDKGVGVLLISEDLDELLSLSDRIVVIYEGEIMGEVPPDDSLVEQIGLMMAGTRLEGDYATEV